jgi:hypothetical protein
VISCKFSNRQHQGAVTLIPDNLFNISEFENGNSLTQIEKLDEVRLDARELSDMYDAFLGMIPQTINDLQDHYHEGDQLCLTAPEETSISERFGSIFSGRKEYETPKRKPKSRPPPPKTRGKNGSEATLDEKEGRGQSSRHPLAKFNYGGYVPSELRKKGDQINSDIRTSQLNIYDYLNYLQDFNHDFLDSLILDKYLIDLEEEEKMRLKAIQEQQQYEEEMRKREENIRREKERRAAMLEYREGSWNAGIMEYLAEFNKADETFDLQIKLENIWTKLKMPFQMKIEMAVKFGHHRLKQESFRVGSEHAFQN